MEAISKVAANDDKFRKTITRKATILKKGVSFSQGGVGVTRRRRAEMQMSGEGEGSNDKKHLSIRRSSSSQGEEGVEMDTDL